MRTVEITGSQRVLVGAARVVRPADTGSLVLASFERSRTTKGGQTSSSRRDQMIRVGFNHQGPRPNNDVIYRPTRLLSENVKSWS